MLGQDRLEHARVGARVRRFGFGLPQCLVEGADEQVGHTRAHGKEELVLVAEVGVERGLGHRGVVGYLFHGHAAEPVFLEQLLGGPDDPPVGWATVH